MTFGECKVTRSDIASELLLAISFEGITALIEVEKEDGQSPSIDFSWVVCVFLFE